MEPTDENVQPITETPQTAVEQPAPQPEASVPISDTQVTAVDEGAYDLDLDLLQPQARKVRLGGKIYDVFPPKVKDIANLARLAGELQKNTGDVEVNVEKMLGAFSSIMPGLKDDNVDLSLEQILALFQFINNMASPTENSALKSYGIEPSTEKKVPPVS